MIPYKAALGPLGIRSTDGRTLAISGLYSLRGPAPVFLWDEQKPFGPVVGMITSIDPHDGWLWAHGLMDGVTDAVGNVLGLNENRLVLLADFDIYEEHTSLDGLDILDCRVNSARLAPVDQWAWGEVLP